MKNIKFLIIPIILSLVACGKYEEGPSLSLRSKQNRITNNWIEVERVVNGSDSSTQMKCHQFDKDGSFGPYSEVYPSSGASGTWSLSEDKSNFTLFWDFEEKSEVFVIKRLTNREIWLEQTTDSSFVELKWERCN